MIQFPIAKINLGLHVVGKRPDGFHDIETVFYPIPLCDAMEILPANDGRTTFTSSGLPIPGNPESNLVMRAFARMRTCAHQGAPSPTKTSTNALEDQTDEATQAATNAAPEDSEVQFRVHLHKAIPMGAGLGGGSSNGACAIRMVNQLRGLALSTQQMEQLALELGSDAPFFIAGKPVYATGRGDQFLPCSVNLSGAYLLVVKPEIHISTDDAYAMITPKTPENSLQEVAMGDPGRWRALLCNDFEEPVFQKFPAIAAIKQKLYRAGATYAAMTGSGSALYGLFENEPSLGQGAFPGCFFWKGQL